MSPARKKIILILVAAVTVLPLLVAQTLFFTGWRPQPTNHGQLINPVLVVKPVELETLAGDRKNIADLRRQWQLVYFADAECTSSCEQQLHTMRQVRLALGKNTRRLDRILLLTDLRGVEWLDYQLENYPGMQVFTGPDKSVKKLARQFAKASGLQGEPQGLYLLDPQGNLMMRFPQDLEIKAIHKDLSRLLKVSQTG